MILTYKLPDEFDLQLYDIVVYEIDDVLIVHRVVGIEEPNNKHPEERWFTLQGDAVENPDRFPVRYSQMKAIYKGERIAYVGSFVLFLQSPAGWLCILLIVVYTIATPIIEARINKAKRKRFYQAITTDATVVDTQMEINQLVKLAQETNKEILLARAETLAKHNEIKRIESELKFTDIDGFYDDYNE